MRQKPIRFDVELYWFNASSENVLEGRFLTYFRNFSFLNRMSSSFLEINLIFQAVHYLEMAVFNISKELFYLHPEIFNRQILRFKFTENKLNLLTIWLWIQEQRWIFNRFLSFRNKIPQRIGRPHRISRNNFLPSRQISSNFLFTICLFLEFIKFSPRLRIWTLPRISMQICSRKHRFPQWQAALHISPDGFKLSLRTFHQ